MKTKKHFTLLLSVLALIAAAGCRESANIDESKNLVKVCSVKGESNERLVSYPGKVIAASDVNLSFRIAGPIAKVNVVQGQKVKKDDVLAEIDERDYKLQLSATEAEYEQIKAEAGRVIELYNRGSATKNDHDKAFYGMQQITAKYNAHKNALADTKLKAPFDGYVQNIFFEASETVGTGMPVISMISSSAPEVEINIPSSDFVKRAHFAEAYCTFNVFEGEIFPLRYIDVAKKANLNQLYATRFIIDTSSKNMPSPGMSANVFIKFITPYREMVSIPITALMEKAGESSVWIVGKENKISRRMVTPHEIKKDGTVIISAGLEKGETVVIAGVKSLSEGETVKIKTPESKTNIGNVL